MTVEFTVADVADLATGAALLGAGGGGSPYIGRLMAEAAIADHGPVQVVDVDELNDDALVAFVSMVGAPTVLGEKLPAGTEIGRAIDALEARLGRPITHLMPAEIGGLNATIPLVGAAARGLPVVDADGMGRAFPEIQMVTPTIHGISATPMALADEKGNAIVLDTINNRWTERLARTAVVEMGSVAFALKFLMTGEQVRRAAIPGTLSAAAELGRLVRRSRSSGVRIADRIADHLNGATVFTGKVVDIERRTAAGFARGRARVAGSGPHSGTELELEFQNEFLIARRGPDPIVTVPDLIIAVDEDLGEPIPTEDIRYGYRISVIAAPCNARWLSSAGLGLVGPRAFGFDFDWVPCPGGERT